MSRMPTAWFLVLLVVLSTLTTSVPAKAATIDARLFTTYNFYDGFKTVYWFACGYTQESTGCFSSGSIGPFGNVGALLEGSPKTKGNTVTRELYIVDTLAGSVNSIILYVYTKVDTITPNNDSVTITLTKTVSLPLIGGKGVSCFMAGNSKFIFIGTNQSSRAVEVEKSDLKYSYTLGYGELNVFAITSDAYGYVSVMYGDLLNGAFFIYSPNGELELGGAGTNFMLSTTAGVSTN
jgi:hypothetical protein